MMKATVSKLLLYSLFAASVSAERESIFVKDGRSRHSELPIEVDNQQEIRNPQGRNSISGCDQGENTSMHHHAPCDEDVESDGMDNSDSLSARTDSANTIESCVSSDGTFGSMSLKTIPVGYRYEMQTDAGTDLEKVLPKLEKIIVDSILPKIFPTKCGDTAIGKRKQRRKLQTTSNDESIKIDGISMNPPDDITTEPCEILTPSDSSSECHVLNGQLSLYLEEDQIVYEDQQTQLQNSINALVEENMNSGKYNEASPEIIDLHYLKKPDPSESNTNDDSDGSVQKQKNRSLRIGLFVGLGTLLAVIAGVILKVTRRVRNNDDQTELQTGGVQTYLDVEEQHSSLS